MKIAAVQEMGLRFTDAMVRAILEGRKTQTRRPIKEFENQNLRYGKIDEDGIFRWTGNISRGSVSLPCARIGDRLWVKETWGTIFAEDVFRKDKSRVRYRATQPDFFKTFNACPSTHMPQWASRITLEITRVRVERLNKISAEDALAEGVESVEKFRELWQSLYQKKSRWNENPLVIVREFRVLGKGRQ